MRKRGCICGVAREDVLDLARRPDRDLLALPADRDGLEGRTVPMTRTPIVGGWYGDALASGEYAILIPDSHIETHIGQIPLDAGDSCLFLRVSNVGGFKFAGQSQNGRGTIEWIQARSWHVVAADSYGVNPVIYDRQGNLHRGEPQYGSQGFRYIREDGSIATGDQTYVDPVNHLWEFTVAGDVVIGQGETSAIAVADGKRYVIEPGDTRFIRVDRQGDQFAVTIVKMSERQTVIHRFTRSELSQYPQEAVPIPGTPVPIPGTPEPEPMPTLQAPNQIDTVRQAMRDHPEIDTTREETRGRILDYVCAALGPSIWGRKSRTPDGTDLNSDALTFLRADGLFEIYDVISGSNGGATWDGFGPFRPGENGYWVKAQPVDVTPAPEPKPVPSDDFAQLRVQLEAMNQAFTYNVGVLGIRIQQITDAIAEQRAVLDAIAAKETAVEFPAYTGRLFGYSVRLNPEEKK
jgi:hypothetical protein